MLHFGFIVGLENADFAVSNPPEYVARLIFDEPDPPPPDDITLDDTTPPDDATTPEQVADNSTPTRPDRTDGTPGRDRNPGRDDAQPSIDPATIAQDAVNML